jgi:limonene-1,2-epoxide hydrolase
MKPKEIVEKWIEAFNNGDAESIAEFYSEEAINHQMPESPVEGKTAIKEMFKREFSQVDMTCIVENIFEDGEWAILEWKDPLGLRGCGFFHIQQNKIIYQRGYWDKLSFLRMHNLPILNK